jgi:type VI secretion system protein ImpF
METLKELLQPCLLDRLTDDEPHKQEESRSQRVISHQKYRKGVLRDLEWLFSTSAYLCLEGAEDFRLCDYPEAWRSVLNFGTRQICGSTAPDMERLQEEMAEAIRTFEPRIVARTLQVRAQMTRNMVTFEVDGELWAHPIPERLHLKTTVDLEGAIQTQGENAHG